MEKKDIKRISGCLEECKGAIVSTNNCCVIEGSKPMVLTCLTSIIHHMLNEKIIDEKELNRVVELAKMNEKEIEKQALEKVKNMLDDLMNK